ncbi:low affinity high capacity ammonium permease [Hypoxylon texense]
MSPSAQVALITGANTGIGEAVARSLATHGYQVIIGSRNLDAGIAVASSLTSRGLNASAVHLNLADEASIRSAAQTIETQHVRLDVLINNAAVFLEADPLVNAGLTVRQRFEQTFVPNLFGQVGVTEAMLSLLRKADTPRIVFVSSRLGSLANALDPNAPFSENDFRSYNCSKAALNMLALEYAKMLDDVRGLVNVVCPGLVKTRLSGFNEAGHTPEVGAERIVQMAVEKGGPTRTFSDNRGEIQW